MTEKQAYKILTDTPIRSQHNHTEYSKALHIALGALEKQIAKRTIFVDGCPQTYLCGSCHYCVAGRNNPNVPIITATLKNYCPNCGQALMFRSDEE